MEHQAPRADGDQHHGAPVSGPCDRGKRPGWQVEVEGQNAVDVGAAHLVEQHDRLHRHDEQKYQRREHVDEPLQAWTGIAPDQVDRDMPAAVTGGGNSPEDEDAEQLASEVITVRDRRIEELAQENRKEDVGRDEPDEARREPLDGIDDPVGDRLAFHAPATYCSADLYLTRLARRLSSTGFGSAPVFWTSFAHCSLTGATAFRHASSCSGASRVISWPGRAAILPLPAASKSAHGDAIFSAHSVVQCESITFFCAADSALYLSLFSTHTNGVM